MPEKKMSGLVSKGKKAKAARVKGAGDEHVPIEWLRQMMRDFLREREWEKYHTPRNLAASIAIEAGELLELFQWQADADAAMQARSDAAFRHAVGEELSDVLMYCVSMANAMGFDIASTVAAKMERNRQKYPAEQYRGRYERPLHKAR
jgi:dCTP diphosphatase